ncbi:hypothetical protein HMPREF9129_1661 [Peptoniphilus indolicus ATCC 29427]|uniref:PIN domain protein n=1 Tax=Peptoniphilus indolicus ATCC 29427 TaxID=997350 RepID=G4D5I1_9FIRM|nr:DUF4411 family protein [Peptoniphilus indolicus]EGY78975.1 hypothetical protein HMPREF9129_1661 [Peptoniphilus indolicus ATCC 29427]
MEFKFLLDTNIFITAYKHTYPMDVFPSFWDKLITNGGNKIILLDKIYDELLVGDDGLIDWIKENKNNFTNITSSDADIISNYTQIADKIENESKYEDTAKYEYYNVADSWICAAALAKNILLLLMKSVQTLRKELKFLMFVKLLELNISLLLTL